MRWMRRIVEDAINCRFILIGGFARDDTARIAIAIKAWKITARNFQADAVTRQKDIRCSPKI